MKPECKVLGMRNGVRDTHLSKGSVGLVASVSGLREAGGRFVMNVT